MSNSLNQAQRNRADEFYTQMPDIEAEMRHYKQHFRGKVVLCNCDDPYESNFFKYFALNFNAFGLKRLIATCYAGSPVAGEQVPLSEVEPIQHHQPGRSKPHKIIIEEVTDANGDGATDLADVEYLLRSRKNVITLLDGDGDFRSRECIELLKQSDIVVTNPPFSLFREYVAQLIEYDKKFIIIGNMNSVTYRDFFPFIMDNKVWYGESIRSGDREFRIPEGYPMAAAGSRIDEMGRRFIRVKGVRWFTNLDIPRRRETLTLYKRYCTQEHPKFDNFDAINVDKVANIPYDYHGVMGVPISFFDRYNPDQFQIIGNENMLSVPNGRGYVNGQRLYARVFIRRREAVS
ncbi:MAG: adenine-specific methyltransferase EcoRI family protein [Symbiobacteriaceae bacterium]|nr:adenine-specific methyltransferase EcoRI family protein [Symbiobacteriaceae bacterium]